MPNTVSDTDFAAPDYDDGAHLDTFRVAEDDHSAEDADFVAVDDKGDVIEPESVPEQMTQAAFQATWKAVWNLPGMMSPDFKPLSITPEKEEASTEAAAAVYDLAAEHFPSLLDMDAGPFATALRILPFGLIQAAAVRAILAERRRSSEARDVTPSPEKSAEFKSARATQSAAPEADPSAFLDGERGGT
ncbi:hypothetical protein KBY28_07735 [Ruegeria pomeroyi]|uniref:hypothetical protein n=1 Tax=Ruegeria pomeroyi TaxID=89184 RepID=UPI001F22785B|nr:hypothetical protein [Ruegeria pomeroyi]MCE8508340.1 hypothetical protein [Ruegeria pomeroyi]